MSLCRLLLLYTIGFYMSTMAKALLLRTVLHTAVYKKLGIYGSSSRLFSIETHYPRSLGDAPPSLAHAQTLFPPLKRQLADTTPDAQLLPVIHHLRSDKQYDCLADFVQDETKLPRSYIEELIRFGAIYFATPVEPRVSSKEPKGTLMPRARGSPGMRDENMSRASRAHPSSSDGSVPKGSYCRVHLNPRRYPSAYDVSDWRERIISGVDEMDGCDNIIFVDKPAGVPMIPTVDNNVENVYSQLCAALGLGEGGPSGSISRQFKDLHCLGRLDACTAGVCGFATSRRSSALFHSAIAERRVTKTYKLLCSGSTAPPADGQLVRHLFKRRGEGGHEDAKPTLLGAYDESALAERDALGFAVWQEAALRVVSCRRVEEGVLDMPLLRPLLAVSSRTSGEGEALYECEVELLTGRTHQVRLQFSALGLPLVGDSRYGPVSGLLHGSGSESAVFGPDPQRVCLQSSSLAFPDLQRAAKAKFRPLWRA